ncbi:type IV pilus secretin PilQ [Endozoicomonas sp. SM1973]|uniref:Type IV pilus secretin PilQ n=1 Tax=Spartinivicinus marinus TaxID=2994442 RepID=A0A853IAH4_9GAMM|nr:type IV pilus secretin PilQ [Spartinivicinus marinus]MCX4026469.1 type IV pilus secretin PilQ [Spartinivicinus marinus]NYZ66841.1 type IV pilus secretin PilQ [Spartinivicinus marinus]
MSTKLIKSAGISLLAAVFSIDSLQALAATIKDLEVASLPGEKVELKLEFDGDVPKPRGYTIEKPARISIDLPGTNSALPNKYNEIGFGSAKSLTILEAKDRTRLIVNLAKPSKYTTRIEGNSLYILIGSDVSGAVATAASQQPSESAGSRSSATTRSLTQATTARSKPKQDYNRKAITNVDFERGESGEGNVVITLSNPNVPLDMSEEAGRIRLEFAGTELPTELRNRLDVVDFATPVHFINVTKERSGAVIVVEPEGFYDYLAYQTDNTLTISVKPLKEQEVEKRRRDRFVYTGEKLSLNFQNIDVRSVLQLIADFTDLNLVASDTVTGDITLRLQNVPWDQALDLVLKAKGLDKRKIGNVLMVAPADEIAAREKQELENDKQIEELAPTFTDLVQINYADSAEIAAVLQGGAEGDVGLLSERGTVQVVERTNSLLIQDTRKKLDEIIELVEKIDIPVKQVQIEARIVEASDEAKEALGVEWGGILFDNKGKWDVQGNDKTSTGGMQFKRPTTRVKADGTIEESEDEDTLFTDLGVEAFTSNLNIGFSSSHAVLRAQLSAIQSEGSAEVISQPKVFTTDKKEALIETGTEIAYQEASSSGATSTSFKKAVLSLKVTPHVTPDNQIFMDIVVNKDNVNLQLGTSVPGIDTNELQTQVLVPDGQTVVIGGVFIQESEKVESKVPFLGDVPIVGRLFRKDVVEDEKKELLIFITPKIVDNALTSR